MSIQWGNAQQGDYLWFKPGMDDNGRKHLLVSETRSGVDGSSSHDHYWENNNGTYGVQLRDKSGTSSVADKKGHIFPPDSTFPGMVNKRLEDLFNRFCP
jgi:hypothetical protein